MTPKKITVIIADDHNLLREGLKMLLNADGEIEVVAEACNGNELVELYPAYQPDVILTDLIMPGIGGIEAIRRLCVDPSVRIVAVTTFDSEFLINQALEAGALGCVIKNAQDDEIVNAVKAANRFQRFYCQSTSARLSSILSKSKYDPAARETHELFSEKEKEVIRLVCEDKSSEEISKILFISKRTVDGMRARILSKMNVKSPIGFVTYAIKNSLFFIDKP